MTHNCGSCPPWAADKGEPPPDSDVLIIIGCFIGFLFLIILAVTHG